MSLIGDNLNRLRTELSASFQGIRRRLPPSVNPPNPSNTVTDFDSGWGSAGASYAPSRKRQRQPFKWG